MKKILIIGGGIAGLSAGIYAAKAGFQPVIYEKESIPGGCCQAWRRGSYTIDNCMHWLTGTRPDTGSYKEWEELGVIRKDDVFIKRDAFYSSELNGETITLWRDIDRTEREMLAISPEDKKEIHKFIECTKIAAGLSLPGEGVLHRKDSQEEFHGSNSTLDTILSIFRFLRPNLESIIKHFKHPLLQKVFTDFMAKDYEAYWCVLSYSFFIAGNADLLEGGSKAIVDRLLETYQSLGGKIHLHTPVSSIIVNPKKENILRWLPSPKDLSLKKIKKIWAQYAEGIVLSDGKTVKGDYVICACDVHHTFKHLLDKKYASHFLKSTFTKKKYTIYSSFHVAFSVQGIFEEVPDTLTFDCTPIDVGMESIDRLCLKNYRLYGDFIAPEGETVLQCSIVQYTKDVSFWKKLAKTPEAYRQHKKNIADAILYRIEERFPSYTGKIKVLDTWTPYSYIKRLNCYHGAYMRCITTAASTSAFLSTEIKHLPNVYLANHWLRYPGGMPTAASLGKLVIEKIKANQS
ncbi:MAG: FAD-dependent oxidoreductase [Lachnospiraceae bacterium]|nr:FAD-dependent oxidoreductase [Lachnospiraceae bacterium]